MPYAANIPEQAAKKRAYDAARYAAARTERLAQVKAHYDANKGSIVPTQRAKRHARAASEGRIPGRPGSGRIYTDGQRAERKLVHVRNYRARKAEAPGAHTIDDVARLRALQKDACAFCLTGFGDQTPHVDHYVPIVRQGSNAPSNLRLLCAPCNLRKNRHDPIEFGRRHGLLLW